MTAGYLFFFLNDTATTEMYTSGHTLSLQDALPFFGDGRAVLAREGIADAERQALADDPAREGVAVRVEPGALEADERSEEHTSELQSLMRISYGVFCLNKKEIKSYTQAQLYDHIRAQKTIHSI